MISSTPYCILIGNRRKRSRIRLPATDVTAIGDKGHSNNSADANLLEYMKMPSALYLIERKRLTATRALKKAEPSV